MTKVVIWGLVGAVALTLLWGALPSTPRHVPSVLPGARVVAPGEASEAARETPQQVALPRRSVDGDEALLVVADRDGEPIPGVRVDFVHGGGQRLSLFTDSGGGIASSASYAQFRLSKPGYVASFGVYRRGAGPQPLVVRLSRSASLRVQILPDKHASQKVFLMPVQTASGWTSYNLWEEQRLCAVASTKTFESLEQLRRRVFEDPTTAVDPKDLAELASLSDECKAIARAYSLGDFFAYGGQLNALVAQTADQGTWTWEDLPAACGYRWGVSAGRLTRIEPANTTLDEDGRVVFAGFSGLVQLAPGELRQLSATVHEPARITGSLGAWGGRDRAEANLSLLAKGMRDLGGGNQALVWTEVQAAVVDSAGRFSFGGLSPGAYIVSANWLSMDGDQIFDGREVELAAGEHKDLGLLTGAGQCSADLTFAFVTSDGASLAPEDVLLEGTEAHLAVRVMSGAGIADEHDVMEVVSIPQGEESRLNGLAPGSYYFYPDTMDSSIRLKEPWHVLEIPPLDEVQVRGQRTPICIKVVVGTKVPLQVQLVAPFGLTTGDLITDWYIKGEAIGLAGERSVSIDFYGHERESGGRLLGSALTTPGDWAICVRAWPMSGKEQRSYCATAVAEGVSGDGPIILTLQGASRITGVVQREDGSNWRRVLVAEVSVFSLADGAPMIWKVMTELSPDGSFDLPGVVPGANVRLLPGAEVLQAGAAGEVVDVHWSY